ncbi:GSCOCG00007480001-RA-CDS [Cotesia congregata]|nr:GSCOCG00007480001-RA-CDS [Cotesia congregata]
MESVVKVGRSVGGGFFRAAGAVLRGTRRVLAAIPLLGIIIKEDIDKDTGGEEAENPEAVSPAEDKSASSPTDSVPESKTEEPASPAAVTLSPAEEKKEAPSSPAPTPAPEAVKEEPEVPVEKVEVSPGPALAAKFPSPPPSPKISPPICSITERKTTEDFPSFAPTSPPPTPIDPSPLQQAQQAAPNATALAEALKPALTNIDSLPITNTTSDSENSSNLHDKLLENSFIEIQEVDNKMADLPEIDAVPDVVEIAPDVADIVEAVPDIADTMEVETEVIEVVPEIVVETEVVEVDAVPPVNAVPEVIEITELEEKITETPQVQEILVPESVGEIIAENIKETAEEVEKVCERFDLKKVTEEISDILGQVEQTSEVIKEDCEKIEDLKVNVEEKVTQEIKAATDEVVEKIEEIKETVEEKMEETCEKVKNLMTTTEDVEADIPPPLPESPIPVPKASADLMNFIASQISEDFGLSEELLPPPPISGLEQELDNLPVPLDPSKQALRLDKNEEERTVSDNEAPSPLSPTEDLLSPPVNPNPSVESSRDKVNGYKDIETIEGVNGNGHVDVNGDGEYDHESATKDSLFQNNHQVINQHQLLA